MNFILIIFSELNTPFDYELNHWLKNIVFKRENDSLCKSFPWHGKLLSILRNDNLFWRNDCKRMQFRLFESGNNPFEFYTFFLKYTRTFVPKAINITADR